MYNRNYKEVKRKKSKVFPSENVLLLVVETGTV